MGVYLSDQKGEELAKLIVVLCIAHIENALTVCAPYFTSFTTFFWLILWY